MDNLLIKAQKHLAEELPFVLYAKPGSAQLTAFLQKDGQLHQTHDFSGSGFAFVSFDGRHQLIIPAQYSEIVAATFIPDSEAFRQTNTFKSPDSAKEFISLVQKGIDAIKNRNFEKVVLSRQEIVSLDSFDLTQIFTTLLHSYPNAFRYCWFHPKTGLWMGATPEQLLKVSATDFQTVALAGTQTFVSGEAIIWSVKEIEEQQFVTDYIIANFEKLGIPVSVSEPYSSQAGNLVHIKTDIQGSLKNVALSEILSALHPTPAVCGLPKRPAMDFIIANENYNREFYSGFLGELNMDFGNDNMQSDLFVNLRCMKIHENQAHIFVGCGITAASDPEKEFLETVNKSMTMKKVLPLKDKP